tara:strand:- start:130 stop:831 length:702 start_codon:yes stop_codon:yes gene_type:complete
MTELIFTLVATHITIACVTLFLHRSQAHKSVTFHPVVSHMMRFWLWLTTGMVTKQWVAVHRKHHRETDVEGDPHSPAVFGLRTVLFKGAWLYHLASKNFAMVEAYGVGTPDDWMERKVYSKHSRIGILLMLAIDLALFGPWGLAVWAVQMIWIPLTAAGIINGLGHYYGYRNFDTDDKSTNIIPWGIVIGGEELHNNHHKSPGSAKLSTRMFELDIGWLYIKIFSLIGLATVR